VPPCPNPQTLVTKRNRPLKRLPDDKHKPSRSSEDGCLAVFHMDNGNCTRSRFVSRILTPFDVSQARITTKHLAIAMGCCVAGDLAISVVQ
jgi:hypothetical protein